MKASDKLRSLFFLQPHTEPQATKHSPLLRDAHTTAILPRPSCTRRPGSRGTVRQWQAGGCPALLSSPANALGGVNADPGSENPESLCLRCKGSAVPCGERLVGNARHGVSQMDKTRSDQEQMGHVPARTRALPRDFLGILRVSYLWCVWG